MRPSADPLAQRRWSLRCPNPVRDRGAVAVEAAIVLPLLALLAFGMIELAIFLRANVAVTTLSREGARTASAEPRMTGFAKDAADAIARSAGTLDFRRITAYVYPSSSSGGAPPSGCFTSPPTGNCIKFSGWTDPVGTTPGYFASETGSWDPSSINACLVDPSGVDNRQFVGVYVTATHDWLIPLFRTGSTEVRARTVMKFEPVLVPPATRCRP